MSTFTLNRTLLTVCWLAVLHGTLARAPLGGLLVLAHSRRHRSCLFWRTGWSQEPLTTKGYRGQGGPRESGAVQQGRGSEVTGGGVRARVGEIMRHLRRRDLIRNKQLRAGVGEIMRQIRGCLVETAVDTCDADSSDCVHTYLDISALNKFSQE